MTRISLREAYDNKDVVAQIYAIRDTAESAEDTANTASDHVDALVPQVEGAVENANSASASAQASAQTVAGYENRLGAVETGLNQTESDLNAVTLRVTTAEGQIVTIQGRVTALETADGQNVKINRINDYAVGLIGNQDFTGQKRATTQNGLSMRTLANAGNNFEIGSTGLYNHLRMRNYKGDGTGYDEHMQIGTDYATSTTCVGRVLFYAPRTVKGDSSEGQTTAGITFLVSNDDTVTVRLTAYKKDGSNVNKVLGTFDGTNWS